MKRDNLYSGIWNTTACWMYAKLFKTQQTQGHSVFCYNSSVRKISSQIHFETVSAMAEANR